MLSAFVSLVKLYVQSGDNGKSAAKLHQDEQGTAKKISAHLVRLLTIPSVQERVISDLWHPITQSMTEILSSEPTDAYAKQGKRVVLLLSETSAIAREKQHDSVNELIEKTADQLVQLVAKQCLGSTCSDTEKR